MWVHVNALIHQCTIVESVFVMDELTVQTYIINSIRVYFDVCVYRIILYSV